MNLTDVWTLGVIAGLAIVTTVTRCFFFLSQSEWQLPRWAQRGLQYAPIAALSAVVAPEVFMAQGVLISSWMDARLYAAAAGAGFFFLRGGSGQAVLGTIVCGMLVYLPLHIGLGW